MAIYELCDGGCGSTNPGKKSGLWFGNRWTEILIKPRMKRGRVFDTEKLLLCTECMKKFDASFNESLKTKRPETDTN